MEEQNRVNEEKSRNTPRQKTEVVTGREKVGEGATRKVRTQGECATKLKPTEEKDVKKKWDKEKYLRKETQRQKIPSIHYRKKRNHLQLVK